MCLSGYLPPFDASNAVKTKDIPIFAYHGERDPMVPEETHWNGVEQLKTLGFNIEYQAEQNLEHSLSIGEIEKMGGFWGKYI